MDATRSVLNAERSGTGLSLSSGCLHKRDTAVVRAPHDIWQEKTRRSVKRAALNLIRKKDRGAGLAVSETRALFGNEEEEEEENERRFID